MFDVKKLLLKEKYSVDVKVNYSSNYWVSGILNISQDNITLIIYGETHEKSDYKYNGQFEQLICTNYLNTVFILLDVALIKSHSARLSQNIGSFYNEYQVSELLFNKDHRNNIANFSQISFKSKDLQKWIGHTQLQNDIIDEYFSKENNQLDTKELLIEIDNMYLIIHYPTNQYWSPADYRAGIEFIPEFNIVFHEEVSFDFIKKKYFELLNLLYLLFGYDLDIDEIKFTNDISFSYYYKQRLDRTYDRNQLVPLGHNLKFNDNNILETPIEIFQKYFRLNDLQKQFFQSFKKYRQFKYGEEKFLGYFRILENIMFDEEILTKEKADDLLNSETRDELKEHHINKCKNKKLKSQDCISYIKFIVYFDNLPLKIKDNLICTKEDIRKIIKLRNDISHFNEYIIKEEKLEKYIEFLEFITIYALFKLLGFSDEYFINIKRFYPKKHLVYN